MRRFVTLAVLLFFTIPFGISISGCKHAAVPTYCNGGDSGVVAGQLTTITLLPKVYGYSLNYAEVGQANTPSATDCKGSNVSVSAYTYGTTDMTIADINPKTGQLCGGTWNRNTAGVPDYTYCNATNKTGIAYISASADGVASNPLPVYVHPIVTSVVLGAPTANCTTDPTTNCCPLSTDTLTAAPYAANSCISQGANAQLVARVFAGTGSSQTNITCQTGHIQFSPQNGAVVNIDPNGVVTSLQPGSTLVTANVSNASSSAGFFSTCPPASITLTVPTASGTANSIVVNQNNTQPLTATVFDTNGVQLTGLSLEFLSTTPTTIPVSPSGSVTPILPGAASISALCQPSSCNPASYNQIGLFGNGKPVVSNSVTVTTPGTDSTVLYMASTQSQYVVPIDFTTNVVGAPFRLPYVPNSMVATQDGATLYFGSSTELMVVSAGTSLLLSREDTTSTGTVLGVSPDNSTIAITDPIRQTITLESSTGSIITTYGGVGTHAEWAPDDQTVYITAGTQLLVYNNFTGWNSIAPATAAGTPVTDVAVTVPSVGAYFAGPSTTARGYCESSTATTANGVTTETNVFYPPAADAATLATTTDRIAATNDGLHILGATVTPTPTLNDLHVSIPIGACPRGTQTTSPAGVTAGTTGGLVFPSSLSSVVLGPVTATAITGVLPTSDSSVAFITYTGSGGVLPAYAPAATGLGTTTYIKLSGAATAPIIGVISTDNSTIYVGTSGDNLVHLINRSTLTDSSTIAPLLTNPSGAPVPVNLISQKPRRTT
jgi:hypothetical protein